MAESNKPILINESVFVRQSGLRSVHVEMDLNDKTITQGYVLTAQARSCLARILNGLERKPPARAWTLTGPYGSGKSYFSLFLMNILGTFQGSHASLLSSLEKIDPELAEHAVQLLDHGSTKGLLPVPITGFRSSLQECVRHGLLLSLNRLNGDEKIKPLLIELEGWPKDIDGHKIIHWLKRFIEVITLPEYGYLGMMLVFDELGKTLEFAAAHPDVSDLFLLQELAEFSIRSGDKPFIFIGILHQSFERYAIFLDSKTQQEWSKVQNRFEDIVFQEPPAQQIRLVANAIEYTNQSNIDNVLSELTGITNEIIDNEWCPPTMADEELIALAIKAYPFHPTALITLPHIFRRLAQNERSVFAYLASNEPASFQEFICHHVIGDFIRLPNLFDYLSTNFQGRLFSGKAKALTETIARLESAPGLTVLQSDLLKTIGIMNWLSESSYLKATETNIILALKSSVIKDTEIKNELNQLKRSSLIIFRRFNQTYAIWQGSDVNIEDRLQKAKQQLSGKFSIAQAVQEYLPPRPIVARKHSYITGTVRYFEVRYVDITTVDQAVLNPSKDASGIVFLCLPSNQIEKTRFLDWAKNPELIERNNIIIGIANKATRLGELLFEMRCLDWVSKNTPELRDDLVARRELRTHTSEILTLIQQHLDQSLRISRFKDSSDCLWLYSGCEIPIESLNDLSHQLSIICDQIYTLSPIIWNEILNRRVLSAQGAAARRNLIEAMLTRENDETLGIEGYPPERSMYESILNNSNFHQRQIDGSWKFVFIKDDPQLIKPSWEAISEFVFNNHPGIQKIEKLYCLLKLPPYGLTDGFIPVLFCMFVILHKNEITLYREGSLLPEPGIPDWELFLRRPELFSIAGCRVTGSLQKIINRFAKGYKVAPYAMPVVRSLVRAISSLPEHTIKTNLLSDVAKNVRTVIQQARSPEALLFSELPIALGLTIFSQAEITNEQFDLFFDKLNDVIDELANEMLRLIEKSRDEWLVACGLGQGMDGWFSFKEIARKMIVYPIDQRLLPLLKRAVETEADNSAIESVLAYIANRPPRTWTDSDIERFHEQVQYYCKIFSIEKNNFISDVILSSDQNEKSIKLSNQLRTIISETKQDDILVLKSALQLLLKEVDSRK